MPKSKGKGGKCRRRKRRGKQPLQRQLTLKESGQEYATIDKCLGNSRYSVSCYDGKSRIGCVRKKKYWICCGDMVLISLREFQDNKADIIHKYYPNETKQIKQMLEARRARPLVFGFLRKAQTLLPYQQNVFYTIPDLVPHECLKIYIELYC
eukprot:402221_1